MTVAAAKTKSSTDGTAVIRREFERLATAADVFREKRSTRNRVKYLKRLRKRLVIAFEAVAQQLDLNLSFPRQSWNFLSELERLAAIFRDPFAGGNHEPFWMSDYDSSKVAAMIFLNECLQLDPPPLPEPRIETIEPIEFYEQQGLNYSQIARLVNWKVPGGTVMADDHARVGRAKMGWEPWPTEIYHPAPEVSGWPKEQPALQSFRLLVADMRGSNAAELVGANEPDGDDFRDSDDDD